MTLYDIFRVKGINPAEVRLIRHGNKEIPIMETYYNNLAKLTEYTSWQKVGKFGQSKYLAIFAPSRGTTALFLGMWEIKGCVTQKDMNETERHRLIDNDLSEFLG